MSQVRKEGNGSGGAYALRGFLYQLLGSIDFATRVLVTATEPDRTPSTITVVLEPAGGADAEHMDGEIEAVQFKRRSRAITDAVFWTEIAPDLLGAHTGATHYRLRTNAPIRLSGRLRRFLDQVREEGLAAPRKRLAMEGGPSTALAHRLDALLATVAGPDGRALQRVERMLGRFDGVTEDEHEVETRILATLQRISPHPENADRLLQTLLGHMLRLGAEGGRSVTVEEIFQSCGVPVAALKALTGFVERLNARFDEAMTRLGYTPDLDCRTLPQGVVSDRPNALVGRSGVGKTWALARAGAEAARNGAGVIWIDSPPSDPTALALLIGDRVQTARGHTARLTVDGVRPVLDALTRDGPPLEICVCLDRFAGAAAALRVISYVWWAEQNIRLVAALPASDPDAFDLPADVTRTEVLPFSHVELRTFLRARNLDWAGLAGDVRELLRRPSLAALYASLGRSGYQPTDEYELVEAVWTRRPVGDKAARNRALAVLNARVDRLLDEVLAGDVARYPWALDAQPPLSDAQIEDLDRNGFVRWTEVDRIAFDHDRLLAWALAQGLARRIKARPEDAPAAAALVRRWWGEADEQSRLPRHATGYVALDLLWHLVPPDASVPDEAMTILRELTVHQGRFDWPQIGTLGQRGQRLALAILRTWEIGDRPVEPVLAALLAGPASSPQEAIVPELLARLRSTEDADVALAARYFAMRPHARALRPLVRLYAQAVRHAKDENASARYLHTRLTVERAVTAVANRFPARLAALAGPRLSLDELSIVSWTVRDLPPSAATRVWGRIRSVLIDRFDGDLIDHADRRLLRRLEPGKVEMCALDDLATVTPQDAMASLQAGDWEISPRAFSVALAAYPPLQKVFADGLATGALSVDHAVDLISVWSERASEATWSALLDRLPAGWTDNPWSTTARLFGAPLPTGLIAALEARQDAPLAETLERSALRRLRNAPSRSPDAALDLVERLLQAMGGPAYGRLVLAKLRSGNDIERRSGVRDVLLVPGDAAVVALRNLIDARIASGKDVSVEALEILARRGPAEALRATEVWIDGSAIVGRLSAAEVALDLRDRKAGEAAYRALRGRVGEGAAYRRTRLLTVFRLDDAALRRDVLRRLRRATGDDLRMVDWVVEYTADEDLAVRLLEAVLKFAPSGDVDVMNRLAANPVVGERFITALRGRTPARTFLRLLSELGAPASLAADDMVLNQSLTDALKFDEVYLNTPRNGQRVLWRADPDLAFEVFDEGLRRGGRVSQGQATNAMQINERRAVDVILRGLETVEDAQRSDELGRALRQASPAARVEDRLLSRLTREHARTRQAAIGAAGWLGTARLNERLEAIRWEDTRPEIFKAVEIAQSRSRRLGAMGRLAGMVAAEEGARRRRLMGILADGDEDEVLRSRHDPIRVTLGDLDPTDGDILRSRLKR